MKIFDGLEELGFKEAQAVKAEDLFVNRAAQSSTKAVKEKVLTAEDCLFEKTVKCPICDTQFKEYIPIKSKLRLSSTDTDLRSYFTPVDPIHYDIYMCKKCGYTALISFFERISDKQMTLISTNITPRFRSKIYPKVLPVDMVIERYKFALLNANIKGSKNSEKAFICLRIAWLYREKNDTENENLFMKNAYAGFKIAYETEMFPFCGLDENVMTYMLGEFARRLGEFSEASKWFSTIIVRKEINPRLKDRAIMQKEVLNEQLAEIKRQSAPPTPVKEEKGKRKK